MSSVSAVEMVSVHKGATVNAHKQTLRWLKAAASVDVFTDLSFPGASLLQHSKHYLTCPDAAALTPANLALTKLRWASSWTAVLTGGQFVGWMLEVDGVLAAEPLPDQTHEKDPTHIYSEPGTYTVTLTVRDNDGLTHTSSQFITVPPPFPVIVKSGSDGAKAADSATAGGIYTRSATDGVRAGDTAEISDLPGDLDAVPGIARGWRASCEAGNPAERPGGGPSTRWEFLLTDTEKAAVVSWNAVDLWLRADGGTQALRVTRVRLFTP